MTIRTSASLALAMTLLSKQSTAFTPNTITFKTTSKTSTLLNSMSFRNYSEDDQTFNIMIRAQECANSESCSIEMAGSYLDEVVQIQSGCAAGTLVGTPVCDDVQFASEVVSSLRRKIEEGSKSASERFWSARQADFESLTLASMNPADDGITLSPIAAITNSPVRLAFFGVALFYVAMLLSVVHPVTPTVLPFTAQEWWWSVRDGYVGDMISQTMKYGGLALNSPESAATAVPFTGQEWLWSFRDGYVGDMISHSAKYGGLVSDSAESVTSMPFTAQEWSWAVRDGYVGDMVAHSFKNGGLVSDSVESTSLPFTGQEWLWAVRDGYVGDILSSSFKNGGL